MPIIERWRVAAARAFATLPFVVIALFGALPARAADTLNVYSIWPENWARPMFEEFEKATGIKVNFVRFSSGEALARVIAEKNNPRVDVLFGGPVETFAAGINEGIFEPYKSPSFAKLPARFKQADGQWIAIADDPLVFMTNDKFLKENNLQAAGVVGRPARSRRTRTCCRWPTRARRAPRSRASSRSSRSTAATRTRRSPT